MKRVLITGCCGVLGENLVHYLAGKHEFELFGLDLFPANEAISTAVSFYQGDITNTDDLRRALQNIDIVVHAASASPAYSREKIFNIVVEGTRQVLEQSLAQGVERVVYVSSTAVYGIPDKMPMTEEDDIQPFHDPYNQAKAQAERLCQEYREHGLIVPILRPRTFLGPNRLGTFAMLFDWAQEGRHFPILGSGHNRYQFLDVEDLCLAIYLCLVKPDETVNDTFNIGAEDFGSMKESYQAVLTEAGFGKKIRCIPARPAMLILDFLSRLNLTPLYKRLYRKVHLDYYVSTDKAKKALGFKAKYSNTETLVRSYLWYVNNQHQLSQEGGNRNNARWNQGALKLAKIFF